MKKNRRARKRLRQGKSEYHQPKKNEKFSLFSLIFEALIAFGVLLGGVYFVYDFFQRSEKLGFFCSKLQSGCSGSELWFGVFLIGISLVGLFHQWWVWKCR